jgi:hypothetical protein
MEKPQLYSSKQVLEELQKHGDSLTRAQLHHLAHGTPSKDSTPILVKGVHYHIFGTYTFYTPAGIQRVLHRKQHRKPYTRKKPYKRRKTPSM